MSTVNSKDDFQAWIDVMYDKLPDIATLRHLVERTDTTPVITICGNENIDQFIEYFENLDFEVNPENTNIYLLNNERRYMLLEPEIEPLRQDPFWTQQGKRKKGKRGRY